MRSATQRWCCFARSKKATSGPVSTMAEVMAGEAGEMFGIRSEVGNPGIDHTARALHPTGELEMPPRFARRFQDQPQPLFDQIPELAAEQRRFGRGAPIKFVRDFDGGFHWCSPNAIKP